MVSSAFDLGHDQTRYQEVDWPSCAFAVLQKAPSDLGRLPGVGSPSDTRSAWNRIVGLVPTTRYLHLALRRRLGAFWQLRKGGLRTRVLRTHLAQIIGISLLAAFVVDLAVLPLIWELLLVPLVVVLTGVEIVARRNEDGASVSRFASGCLVFIGFALLAAGLVSVVVNWDSLDVSALLRQLALPIWLSVLVLPYVYLIGIYAAMRRSSLCLTFVTARGGGDAK